MARQRKERTFSPADLKLYYESPFASWLEQLDRDEPGHGIKADFTAIGPGTAADQDPLQNRDFIDQLISAGNQVVVIENRGHEAGRQLETVNAMRAGAHFIFNAHLSVLPLAGRIDILMRVDGASRLGEHHYVPAQFCYRPPSLTDLPVELCCFVDMLEHLQGLRPAEILRITDPNSAAPQITRLPAESYMFDYRKLKLGYRQAQMEFDPGHQPDPSDSRHWGRWSSYARKVLTQQMRRKNPAA